MKRAAFLTGFFVALPTLALAAAPQNFSELANLLATLFNGSVAVLITAGIAIYMYGISTNILNVGGESVTKLRGMIFWGIITLFVMVSIWGILSLLQETFFDASSGVDTVKKEDTIYKSPDMNSSNFN